MVATDKAEATRERILDAARVAFSEKGFGSTSIRTIAAAAAVDPALPLHYFGSKAGLFVAAVELPLDPAVLLQGVAADPDQVGMRIATAYLTVLDDERTRGALLSVLRSAASDETAAAMLRSLVTDRIVQPAVDALGVDQPALRATLVGSQLVGLAFVRHVVAVEPLVSTPIDTLAAAIAPTLQRYLTGDLT